MGSTSGVGKVKDHLRSIYREFIRKRILKLTLNGEELVFNDPKVLNAPKHDEPNGEPILWRKEINFDIEVKYYGVYILSKETRNLIICDLFRVSSISSSSSITLKKNNY